MSENTKSKATGSVFELTGTPPMGQAIPLALQHVVAMIVGCVTPAIIAGNAGNLSPGDKVLLIQSSLVIAGIATLIQLFPVGGKRFRISSGLPVILGASFSYLALLQTIAAEFNIATIMGAELCGGIAAVIVGIFIKKLRRFFPPLVAGTVVFTIGLSLYPTAINYMAGGASNTDLTKLATPALLYGSWQNWLVALIVLAVVVCLNHFGKGIFKLASILFGIVIGYIVALCFGMVDFTKVASAGWFQLPKPMHFGMEFQASPIISMVILFVVNSIQAVGDFSATTMGGLDREPTDDELSGGIAGSGFASMISSFMGGLPCATYSQNVGIVATTKVVNRVIFTIAAGFILIAGLIPKFSGILTTIPQCVLGGATISVFASITMTGIKLITTEEMNYRNTSIVGLAVAVGMGVTLVPQSLAMFPDWVSLIFGKSAVVLATIITVVLNIVIPRPKPGESK